MKAGCMCVGYNSRIVQINPESMRKGALIGKNLSFMQSQHNGGGGNFVLFYSGLRVFLPQVSMYGITGYNLLESHVDVKTRISGWMQEGLKDGVVQPNPIRQRHGSDKIQEALR